MVKAMTIMKPTVRRFEGVVAKTSEKACIELENNASGVLNSMKFKVDERPVYNYVNNKGLDTNLAVCKIGDFCHRMKDGIKLFKDIMESGLNLKK